MKPHVPQANTSLECPVRQKNSDVTFEVNVFRGSDRGGLEMTDCSEFSNGTTDKTCTQQCIHTTEAQQLHEKAIRQHQDELRTIGSNVIG